MDDEQNRFFNKRVNEIGASAAFKEAESAGVFDREDAAAKSASGHAEKWFNGTKHLLDPEQSFKIEKLIRMSKRGILSSRELNIEMGRAAGAVWQPWEPDTSPKLNVPDHLGQQFG